VSKKQIEAPQDVKGQFRSSSNPRNTLSHVRSRLNLKYYPSLIAWIPRINYKGRQPLPNYFPKDIRQLSAAPTLERISAAAEIAWATHILLSQTKRIAPFIQLKQDYERSVLAGDYDAASAILDQVQEQFGASLWLIETRISFLQNAFGLEQHKAYVASIRDILGKNVVAYIAYYLSQRNEPATSPSGFSAQMSTMIDKLEISSDFKSYLAYKLTGNVDFSNESYASVLRFEETFALVDYYETYLYIASTDASVNAVPNPLFDGIDLLEKEIPDQRLTKLALIRGSTGYSAIRLESQKLEPLDLLVQGRLDSARRAAVAGFGLDARDISLATLAALASTGSVESQAAGRPTLTVHI
jgi:hypothetical protein